MHSILIDCAQPKRDGCRKTDVTEVCSLSLLSLGNVSDVKMEKTTVIEQDLKSKSGKLYYLKPNSSGKAEVWQQFSLVHRRKTGEFTQETDDVASEETHVKYLCACNKCFKVYTYRSEDA